MKNSPHDVQTIGGGVKGFLNNVRKNCTFLQVGFLKALGETKLMSISLIDASSCGAQPLHSVLFVQ